MPKCHDALFETIRQLAETDACSFSEEVLALLNEALEGRRIALSPPAAGEDDCKGETYWWQMLVLLESAGASNRQVSAESAPLFNDILTDDERRFFIDEPRRARRPKHDRRAWDFLTSLKPTFTPERRIMPRASI